MAVKIAPDWHKLLFQEFEKPYFKELTAFVTQEYNTHTCYPAGKNIFAAFDNCPINKLKVVIIGQDPYHGPRQANGLCFSVHEGIPHPPSLINIFKELEQDAGKPYPESGDLMPWAQQGVLLLNATLTVRKGQAGSHQKQGWETFTNQVIKIISTEKNNLVFMLWGGFAKQKMKLIDTQKHHVLTSGHPSPLSANRGFWFGNKHFTKCNDYLEKTGQNKIIW